MIRVLALLFKKQDYNRYYLDRHSLGDLEYQYKKEENPRQLRVVIDLHKSHIDFFLFPGFILSRLPSWASISFYYRIFSQRSKYASDCHHQETKPTSAYLHILQH